MTHQNVDLIKGLGYVYSAHNSSLLTSLLINVLPDEHFLHLIVHLEAETATFLPLPSMFTYRHLSINCIYMSLR